MPAQSVLLVEDSEFMAQQVSDTLQFHEYNVTVTHSAAAARDIIETGDIDCVLTNHDLPDDSGLDFARSLPSSVPVILLTTTSLDSIAAEAIQAGITEFIHKDNLATGSMHVLANRIDVAIRAT